MKTQTHETVVGRKTKLKLLGSLMATSLLLLLPSARAQLAPPTFTWPVYEPFGEYTNNTFLGSGNSTMATNVWNQGNGAGSSNPQVHDYAALSYPDLVTDTNPAPKGVTSANATGSRDAGAFFTAHAGTIYCSFLISNINNQGTVIDRMFFSLQTSTSVSSGFGMSVYLTTDYRLKIRKNPSGNPSGVFTTATPVLTTNATHLIVIRYQTNNVSSAPAEVDLWLDPPPFGDNASIPTPTLSTTNGANVNSFDMVALPSRGAGIYTFDMDEIRLGDTWASVTPLATPAPGPMYAVTGGGVTCASSPPSVGLSGSTTTNAYWLFTNGVPTGLITNGTGTALDFGAQTAQAYFSVLASNSATAYIGWMSNSVVCAVKAPVNLLTSPLPVTSATNSRAEFVVSCTGDLLTYQWYRNGIVLTNDSHLSGSTTNDLIIWPATSADIGGYYCVISDTCGGIATSTTNALTLDAPANLVWYGDHFTTLPLGGVWDVSTSFNWNGGGTVFNEGDNVTFDDTYNGALYGTILPLTGTLTPTHMTYGTAQQLIWAGTGSLAGNADLLVNGSGRLIISNSAAGALLANPYTGGTVISNGTVYVQVANALGTGPITLAGGRFETLNKLAFSNNVFVTANSICQLDQSGNQSITFLGSVIGDPGITLVFTNSSTLTNSPNWVVFNGPFTNNSAIVLASSATNSTQRLTLNTPTNNPQIFNGPISEVPFGVLGVVQTNGVGGMIKQGAGAAYLNAPNTYTLGTTNLGGLLAGSGSISGPLAVFTNATIGAGTAGAIGTFTVNSSLTFIGGNAFIRVDKSLGQPNDKILVTGGITNGGTGTVTVTNIGAPALVAGDSFQIFSGAVSNGAALIVTGGGVGWVNNLAINGSIQVHSVLPDYPTNISVTVGGGTMTLAWPDTHLGWILQIQTNSLSAGLTLATNKWLDIPITANSTSTIVTTSPTNPAVFYRLRHP